MSAERLREAARVLRERAEAAADGPWEVSGLLGAEYDDLVIDDASPNIIADCDTVEENAAYIATMHPSVGLALADWLDEVAGWREEGLGLIPYGNLGDAWACIERQANVVADKILGDAP